MNQASISGTIKAQSRRGIPRSRLRGEDWRSWARNRTSAWRPWRWKGGVADRQRGFAIHGAVYDRDRQLTPDPLTRMRAEVPRGGGCGARPR